ncbi:MAG: helix-turn-helix domain-containing protein [Floccifex sp.]
METLGNRIQKLRKENNLNKEQFGKSIGITGTGLNNYEKDLRSPSADIIAKICEVYGVSADYLLFGVSADNKSINERTGLSNNAIDTLSFLNSNNHDECNKEVIRTLNEILNWQCKNLKETNFFPFGTEILLCIGKYLHANYNGSTSLIDTNTNKKIEFNNSNLEALDINTIISTIKYFKENFLLSTN